MRLVILVCPCFCSIWFANLQGENENRKKSNLYSKILIGGKGVRVYIYIYICIYKLGISRIIFLSLGERLSIFFIAWDCCFVPLELTVSFHCYWNYDFDPCFGTIYN